MLECLGTVGLSMKGLTVLTNMFFITVILHQFQNILSQNIIVQFS